MPHFFAITLDRIATDRAAWENEEKWLRDFVIAHTEWLKCLTNDDRLTFDLRFICHPSTEHYRRGAIQIVLIGRFDGGSADEMAIAAQNTFNLCRVFFENLYEFSLVTLPQGVEKFRAPFEIGAAGEILRRVEDIRLDTLEKSDLKVPLGFTGRGQVMRMPEVGQVHVCPFLSNPRSFEKVFSLMLMQPSPTAICFTLKPTLLTPREERSLEHQIRACEAFAQSGVSGTSDNIGKLSPTLQERARVLQRHLTSSFFGLREEAVLLQIRVIGEKAIPTSILDALGSKLTLPPGGLGASVEGFLYGGYEIRTYKDAQIPAIRDSITQVTLGEECSRSRFQYLFQAKEASGIFTMPIATSETLPGVKTRNYATRLIPIAAEMIGETIGHSGQNGTSLSVCFDADTFFRHIWITGRTGTGKSSFAVAAAEAKVLTGEGVVFMDPHGDGAKALAERIPPERIKDVIYFDAGDFERPFGINPLEFKDQQQRHFQIQETLEGIKRRAQAYDKSFIGPYYMKQGRGGLQVVTSNPNKMGTILQFNKLFFDRDFVDRFLPLSTPDPRLEEFIEDSLKATEYSRQSSDGSISAAEYLTSKLDDFLGDPHMRNIFGQYRSSFSFEDVIREQKILIVDLAKGRIGELNAQFLGTILITKLQSAAMSQAAVKYEDRKPIFAFVDEFQSMATENFSTILSEARKYKLSLTLINQFASQLDPKIREALTGNVGTTITFRVGATDAETLEPTFRPVFSQHDLINLPNFNAYVSTLSRHEVTTPFSMTTNFDPGAGNPEIAAEIKERSRRIYGRRREDVEREIEESLSLGERESFDEWSESSYG